MNSSYNDIIEFLLYNANFTKVSERKHNSIFKNVDILLHTYKFKNNDMVVLAPKKEYIYIYNTHNNEKYSDDKTVVDAANMLSGNLKKIGIDSIVEERKVSDYQVNGINYYEISRKFLEDRSENITYYVDIHRDSVKNTTIEINNKKYAKIMFVLGLENENYLENKKVMEKMNNYLNIHYPGISRGIYEKKGIDVNGVYNQDYNKNILLIEVGGIENNIEEVNNSTEIIALMLYTMLGDSK